MIELLKSKIHRATVTNSNLNYEGSISIAQELCEAAQIIEYQKVCIVDLNNGNRFETYVIFSDVPGTVCLNGAAARKVCVGDLIIIMAYRFSNENDLTQYTPVVVHLNEQNQILDCK